MKTAVISPSLTISYEEAGQGTPLVLLHAFPLSSRMWAGQRTLFASDYRVLTPNFRGIGGTSKFGELSSLQTMADDLSLWLDFLGIEEKIVLGGLSMGGYVALEFARAYEDRLKGLILADTRADTDTEEGKKGRNEMIEFAKESTGEAVAERMVAKLLGESTRRNYPDVATYVKEIAAANSGTELADLVAAMRDRRDSTAILASISVPTLVLGGSEDVVSPPSVMEQMAALIPDSEYVVINGVGHLPNLEQPAGFELVIQMFLARLK